MRPEASVLRGSATKVEGFPNPAEDNSPYQVIGDRNIYSFKNRGYDPRQRRPRFENKQHIEPWVLHEAKIITYTDGLIGAFDGTIGAGEVFLDGRRRYEGEVDEAIYLDKSARPVRALVAALWPQLAGGGRPPRASFLNIHKESWLLGMGYSQRDQQWLIGTKDISIDKLDQAYLLQETAKIRALYLRQTEAQQKETEKLIEGAVSGAIPTEQLKQLWRIPTRFDGKHVAIVDEVRSTGATLRIATQLIDRAIPEAKLEPVFWSTPYVQIYDFYDQELGRDGKRVADSEKPVWYDGQTAMGRGGISNKNPEYSQNARSWAQRVGATILSVSMRSAEGVTDIKGNQLREDFLLLAERLKNGEAVYRPSRYRTAKEQIARYAKHYGGDGLEAARAVTGYISQFDQPRK